LNLSNNKEFIDSITGIILDNLTDDNFGVEDLVLKSGMSRYRLIKKLRKVTGKGINQFIREIRLGKAVELLQDDSFTIAEIAYRTGFGSPSYFNKCFRDFYGYPPGNARGQTDDDFQENYNQGKGIRSILLKYYPTGIIAVILIVLILVAISELFRKKTVVSDIKNIAVMPFQNLTNDPDMDIWQYALQRNLITNLTGTGELEVILDRSIRTHIQNQGLAGSPVSLSIATSISQKLNADYFITGSYQRAGEEIKLDASLCDTRRNVILKSFEVNGPFNNEKGIFNLGDILNKEITQYMLISRIISKNPYYQHSFTAPRSVDALRYFHNASRLEEPAERIGLLKKALSIDSTFYQAAFALEFAYGAKGDLDSSRILLIKNFHNRDRMSEYDRLYAGWAYSFTFGSYDEQIFYLKDLVKMDEEDPDNHYLLGLIYCLSNQYEKAVPELEISMKILERWGDEFLEESSNYHNFKWLSIAYNNTNQLWKQKKLTKKAERYIDHPWINLMKSNLAFSNKDSTGARKYIEKARIGYKRYNNSEGLIYSFIADFLKHANKPEIAEQQYRIALELEPDNLEIISKFADFCYIYNKHTDPELMEKAMELCKSRQQYYEFLSEKGMCLLMQGEYAKALDAVQKAWDEAPFKVYRLKYYLEEVKKKVSLSE